MTTDASSRRDLSIRATTAICWILFLTRPEGNSWSAEFACSSICNSFATKSACSAFIFPSAGQRAQHSLLGRQILSG
jgi:hypothetical protein